MAQTAFETNSMDAKKPPYVYPESNLGSASPAKISRIDRAAPETVVDLLAVEEPLEIQLTFGPSDARRTKSITVTMRTPGHDEELATGFLLTEGVLADSTQILHIDKAAGSSNSTSSALQHTIPGNIVRVEIEPGIEFRTATLERNFYTTSSCGICGKASLMALRSVCPPRRRNDLSLSAETLYALPGLLRNSQQVFAATGGLHGAALFTSEGKLILSREDVGRHNAVDKLLGNQFLADAIPLYDKVLMLSGRVSFELLQKSAMAGIPMVAAVGAPSSLAVKVAQEFDITLIGFLRDRRFNVYHGIDRIYPPT
ncbi:formate dehydrogenase accessory sulfurtransferase FdhD [Edaphobacter aggregans]|uniref:formate dehydrogenase accessory sulfurtransferase FdhD n=1 Tax=Edaphobacter aggregans TaxID=570835 RepID=UPI000A978225|nr:formate dehydrogenase accessory sulfurtransferase FdhD [Edaphobacter aggregans]